MRHYGPAMRRVFRSTCPGCGRGLHAPCEEAIRKQMARHARNCNAVKTAAAVAASATPEPEAGTYEVRCPGCASRLTSASSESIHLEMASHAVECLALRELGHPAGRPAEPRP